MSWQNAEEGECFDDSPPVSTATTIKAPNNSNPVQQPQQPQQQQSSNNPPPIWGGGGGRGGPPIHRGGRGRGRYHGRGFDRGNTVRPFERANSFNSSSNDSSPPRPFGMNYNRQRSNDWSNNNNNSGGGGGRGFRGGGRGRGRGRGRGSWNSNYSHNSSPHTGGSYAVPPQRDSGGFIESNTRGGPSAPGGNKGKYQWQRSSSVGTSSSYSDINPKSQYSSFAMDRVVSAPNVYSDNRSAHRSGETASSPSKLPSFSSMASNFASADHLKSSLTSTESKVNEATFPKYSSYVSTSSDKAQKMTLHTQSGGEAISDEFGRAVQPTTTKQTEKSNKKLDDIEKTKKKIEVEISSKKNQLLKDEKQVTMIPEKVKLTCSSLKSPELIKKAENIVTKMNNFVNDASNDKSNSHDNSCVNNQSLDLPSKEQILNCLKQIEKKIKENKDKTEGLESEISSKQNQVKRVKEEVRSEEKCIDEQVEARQKRLVEAALKQEIAAAEMACSKGAKDNEDRSSPNQVPAISSVPEITSEDGVKANSFMKALADLNPLPMLHRPEQYHDLIDKILVENRKRAQQAHENIISSLLPSLSPEALQNLKEKELRRISEYSVEEITNHNNEGNITPVTYFYTTAEWTQLTREIEGKSDALYISPDCSPFYSINEASHMENKELIVPKVRSKKEILRKRWEKLGYEYASKQQLYESRQVDNSNNVSQSAEIQQESSELSDKQQSAHINPYRRPRRANGSSSGGLAVPNYTGDIARSDYEQELIIAELAAKEEMERRIRTGRCDVPRQIHQVENEQCVQYIDTQNHRYIEDPMLQDEMHKQINPWSDTEKCIFLDRWLQYPKNFRKIASFLRNKSTADCVRFYYDSKKSIPYKSALKEHWLRRKKRLGETWKRTIEAVQSVGAEVVGEKDDGSPEFALPKDENSYSTRFLHPKSAEVFKAYNKMLLIEKQNSVPSISRSVSQESTISSESKRKLDSIDASGVKPTKNAKLSPIASRHNYSEKSEKRASQKWTDDEHKCFVDAVGKHGKNWKVVSSLIGTKSVSQVKNHYQTYKGRIILPSSSSAKDEERATAHSVSASISIVADEGNASFTSSPVPASNAELSSRTIAMSSMEPKVNTSSQSTTPNPGMHDYQQQANLYQSNDYLNDQMSVWAAANAMAGQQHHNLWTTASASRNASGNNPQSLMQHQNMVHNAPIQNHRGQAHQLLAAHSSVPWLSAAAQVAQSAGLGASQHTRTDASWLAKSSPVDAVLLSHHVPIQNMNLAFTLANSAHYPNHTNLLPVSTDYNRALTLLQRQQAQQLNDANHSLQVNAEQHAQQLLYLRQADFERRQQVHHQQQQQAHHHQQQQAHQQQSHQQHQQQHSNQHQQY